MHKRELSFNSDKFCKNKPLETPSIKRRKKSFIIPSQAGVTVSFVAFKCRHKRNISSTHPVISLHLLPIHHIVDTLAHSLSHFALRRIATAINYTVLLLAPTVTHIRTACMRLFISFSHFKFTFRKRRIAADILLLLITLHEISLDQFV